MCGWQLLQPTQLKNKLCVNPKLDTKNFNHIFSFFWLSYCYFILKIVSKGLNKINEKNSLLLD